jgi:hypothetical protein
MKRMPLSRLCVHHGALASRKWPSPISITQVSTTAHTLTHSNLLIEFNELSLHSSSLFKFYAGWREREMLHIIIPFQA